MDRLWAPWRINYIKAKQKKGCIFCQAAKFKRDYVIFRSRHAIAMLNIFPYNNGHVMVSPIRHIRDLGELNESEILDVFGTLNETKKLLEKALKPQGFNIGINLASSAGAGITNHLHIHIVPRWAGDTNFMPVTANTKVISQSLDELYRQLNYAQSKSD